MTIDALICDVDGTLADTEESHRTAFNRAFEGCGLGWSWSRSDYRVLLDVTGGKERIAAFIEMLPISARERHVPLREGVERLLEEALTAGCQLAIASTTTAANIEALLGSAFGAAGLHMFAVIACGDQVRAKKPAPDIYRMALAALNLTADRAIAFEDSVNGLRAATDAGLWTLVTPTYWTQDGDFGAAGLVLPRLGDQDTPLRDEPGRLLEGSAWLTFDELRRISRPARPLSTLDAIYRGLA